VSLITAPNLSAPDDFYEALLETHQDLSPQESHALNARLVLLLANHVGAMEVLREALRLARGDSGDSPAHTPNRSANIVS
jgi:hypothetical protein